MRRADLALGPIALGSIAAVWIDGERFIFVGENLRRFVLGKPALPNEDRKAIDPKGVE